MAPHSESSPIPDRMSQGGTHRISKVPVLPKQSDDRLFTEAVINAIGPKATPRIRQVMSSLIRHVHDFARENDITIDEWMAALEMVIHLALISPSKFLLKRPELIGTASDE